MLPPLNYDSLFAYHYEYNAYAVLTGADCCSSDSNQLLPRRNSSSFFKVVIISISANTADLKYNLHTFFSGETIWSVRTDCFKGTAVEDNAYGFFSDCLVHRGTPHWIFINRDDPFRDDLSLYVANLNTQTNYISVRKLPGPVSRDPCLMITVHETLSLLRMHGTGPILELWEQQEDTHNIGGTSEWLCT